MPIPECYERDPEQVRYNVYAFRRDVTEFQRKVDRARKEHTRKKWKKKLDFAIRCLHDNEYWLSEFESKARGAPTQRDTAGGYAEIIEDDVPLLDEIIQEAMKTEDLDAIEKWAADRSVADGYIRNDVELLCNEIRRLQGLLSAMERHARQAKLAYEQSESLLRLAEEDVKYWKDLYNRKIGVSTT